MTYQRLTDRELPPYAFLPGKFPHPEKEGGHGFGLHLNTYAINDKNYKTHEDYLYALDLYNLGFYWESHVYLEAIWNENKRKGPEADLLKAIIKLGAAGIKYRMEMNEAGQGHLNRAHELFSLLPSKVFLGINGIDYLENLEFNQPNPNFFSKYLVLD